MAVPTQLRANFDIDFTVVNKASEVAAGYTPKFVLGGAASLTSDGTVNGDDIDFSLVAANTAAFATGQYWWQIITDEDAGAGRTFIDEGLIWVQGAISGSGVYDGRSVAKQVLDAIDAAMLGKATKDQQSYVIQSGSGSRSLSRLNLAELVETRKYYAALVAAEERSQTDQSLFRRHKFEFVDD